MEASELQKVEQEVLNIYRISIQIQIKGSIGDKLPLEFIFPTLLNGAFQLAQWHGPPLFPQF